MLHVEQLNRPCASDVRAMAGVGAPWPGEQRGNLLEPDAKSLYFGLLDAQPDEQVLAQSRQFLSRQLSRVAHTAADLPVDIDDLAHWMQATTAAVGKQYCRYLAERKSGGARRYFPTKSHALHFLSAVAPTKLVDGAWLYGLISQWRDSRYSSLIRIYLEELGDGDPEKNHVLLYKKLLDTHECNHWKGLDASHFVQGAIQLSLAQHASAFVPEVIGFNLGYEQLPLHLLICAYELKELGIDPYYFTLHVTIDNAGTGHAARAVQSVTDAMPHLGDKAAFYQRVRNGYRLNALGAGTTDIIAGFDLEQALLDMLASKASVGAMMHSDYCRIAGRTVNDWLSARGQIRGFVQALETTGWIRRHENPDHSRFWKLLVGEKGPMFGVFDAYERQLVYDWIAGDSAQSAAIGAGYRDRGTLFNAPSRGSRPRDLLHADAVPSRAEDRRYMGAGQACMPDDFNTEAHLLKETLANAPDQAAAMDLLVPWLSPVHHHTAAGLMATRVFSHGLRA